MSSATLDAAALVSPVRASPRWIISRREDLTWFIGSGVSGYLALILMAAGFPVLPLQMLWFFTVDGPHVIATVTRTYCDRAERKRLGPFLLILIPLVLIGPAASFAGIGPLFLLFAVCWQQWHVVKQHLGFVMLYKAKNRERDRVDLLMDRWFLLSSLVVPLALFVVRTQAMHIPAWTMPAVVGLYGSLAAAWLARQIVKFHRGAEMNPPKLWLIAAVVPLQWMALLHASHYGPQGILRAGIALGLFHGLQYHRLVWFHNRNRYSQPGAAERNGFAVTLASNVAKYLALAIGLNFLLAFLPAVFFPQEAMQCAIWGLAFTHYCLDARIWRVRGDKELAAALHLA